VARVEGDRLQLIREHDSIFGLATAALTSEQRLGRSVEELLSDDWLDYDPIYEGRSGWRILPSADHPGSQWRVLVSGTGLTHMASVKRRDAMHARDAKQADVQQETDSMRMYRWGVEGGKPAGDAVGAAPEWFYKGNGSVLRGHNETLTVPEYAEDGGEEPEIAGVYIIDSERNPRRIGFTVANEFSDHKFEKRNYLYLAHSKLRNCAIGPELSVDLDFSSVSGTVRVERRGEVLWSSEIQSGQDNMCHSLTNLEHHHFKYEQHRIPGDLHVHFFGADAFSFGSGIALANGDVMHVEFAGFGRALRNPIGIEGGPERLVMAKSI